MNQTCTTDLLVKFLYQETTAREAREIREGIDDDLLLREEFKGLEKAYRQLPKVKFSASQESLRKVLEYSRQTALEKQR